jgi:histidine triad (HIT) family protein
LTSGGTIRTLTAEEKIVSDKTIFEKIRDKEVPSEIVHEDDTVVAFRDIDPKAPVHVLVIPKKRIETFSQLTQWEDAAVGAFFRRVSEVAQRLGLDQGYRIVINCGPHGQQSVDYLHAHILGGRQLTWPPG